MKEIGKVVSIKWDLRVVKYSEHIKNYSDDLKRYLKITDNPEDNYCKVCVLKAGMMCIHRAVCRCDEFGEIFVNGGVSFLEETTKEFESKEEE
jgi:hypothetical protein